MANKVTDNSPKGSLHIDPTRLPIISVVCGLLAFVLLFLPDRLNSIRTFLITHHELSVVYLVLSLFFSFGAVGCGLLGIITAKSREFGVLSYFGMVIGLATLVSGLMTVD